MSDLSLEAYARLLAHLACRRGTPLSEILDELGISADSLKEGEAAQRDELASAWTKRSGIVAMKFAAALGKELTQLGSVAAPAAAPAPALAKPSALAEPLPPATSPRSPDLPSFLQQPAAAPSGLALPPPPPLEAAASPPAPVAPPPVVPAVSKLASTGDLDVRSVLASIQRGPLPFSASSSPSPASIPEKAPAGGPRPSSGTVQVDFNAAKASVGPGPLPSGWPSMPGAAATPPGDDFAQLPLETYASVTRALAQGQSREEALAKHRVSADVFDRLAHAWAQRFQREPHLLARFKELATAK